MNNTWMLYWLPMGDAGALFRGEGDDELLCNLTPESKSAGRDDKITVSLCV